MSILELNKVSKKFGNKQVLDSLDLSVPKGSIYGFVGENGAGKTTTMKLILGLEELNAGEILVKGKKVNYGNTPTNQTIGYLPDVPQFYDYMYAKEYLKLCGQVTGMEGKILKERTAEMLELVGLAKEKKKIRGFSRGMKQRLGIAQALLNGPDLLICDEPTSALDPGGRNEFLELLASLRGRATILFSTHILSDVERICDHVGILNQGKLVVNAPLKELKQQYAKPQIDITFETEKHLMEAASAFQQLQKTSVIHHLQVLSDEKLLRIAYEKEYSFVLREALQILLEQNIAPHSIQKIDPSLEAIFLEVTQP